MAPMKRKAAFAKRSAKRAKTSELSLVVDTIGHSAALPGNLRDLLKHALPTVLSANKVDRHEYEVEVVKQAQQALAAVQASLEAAHKEALGKQNVVIAPAELAGRTKAKKQAEAALEAAKAKLVNDKSAVKDAEKAASEAADVLKAAQKEEASADKALQRVAKKREHLSDALAKEFELVLNNSSACPGGKEAVRNLKAVGKEFGMDNTLLETLPSSCKKAPDTRSEFEAMVFTSLNGLITASIADLGKQVDEAEAVKAAKTGATNGARGTLESAQATLKAASETLEASQVANTEGAKAVRKGDHHVRAIWEDMRQACDAQDAAAAAVTNLKENVLAAFNKLKEKEPEPEPVEEPPQEEAPPAESTEAAA